MSDKKTVSIVLYTEHKTNEDVEKFDSYFRNLIIKTEHESFEIIIIDNASKATRQKAYSKKLVKNGYIVITHLEKLKVETACERALQITEGQYVFLMSGDTCVPENWLFNAIKYFVINNVNEIHAKYGNRIVNGFKKD